MNRSALPVAAALAAFLPMAAVPSSAADNQFQTMLEADVTALETKLQLSGDTLKQVDAILQDGVSQRMAAINKLGIVYGQKPGITTLLQLQSQMDDIRTEQQTALSKILNEQQMYVVEQAGQEDQQQFRAAVLGQS